MCFPRIDRTVLGIIALTLAAGGALTVLTKYNVPQVNETFFGANPFAIKRDAIEGTMNWLFAGIALVGVLVQAFAFISNLPDRQHSTFTYAMVFIVSTAATVILLWVTTYAGYVIARRQWLPGALEGQREMFQMTEMLLRNNGLEDQHVASVPIDSPELPKLREEGQRRMGQYIDQLERLLDVSDTSGTHSQRLDRIRQVFAREGS